MMRRAAQNAKFDVHVCGEGGEYESLTLDCPLYQRRLVMCVVACGRRRTHADDSVAFAFVMPLTQSFARSAVFAQ